MMKRILSEGELEECNKKHRPRVITPAIPDGGPGTMQLLLRDESSDNTASESYLCYGESSSPLCMVSSPLRRIRDPEEQQQGHNIYYETTSMNGSMLATADILSHVGKWDNAQPLYICFPLSPGHHKEVKKQPNPNLFMRKLIRIVSSCFGNGRAQWEDRYKLGHWLVRVLVQEKRATFAMTMEATTTEHCLAWGSLQRKILSAEEVVQLIMERIDAWMQKKRKAEQSKKECLEYEKELTPEERQNLLRLGELSSRDVVEATKYIHIPPFLDVEEAQFLELEEERKKNPKKHVPRHVTMTMAGVSNSLASSSCSSTQSDGPLTLYNNNNMVDDDDDDDDDMAAAGDSRSTSLFSRIPTRGGQAAAAATATAAFASSRNNTKWATDTSSSGSVSSSRRASEQRPAAVMASGHDTTAVVETTFRSSSSSSSISIVEAVLAAASQQTCHASSEPALASSLALPAADANMDASENTPAGECHSLDDDDSVPPPPPHFRFSMSS